MLLATINQNHSEIENLTAQGVILDITEEKLLPMIMFYLSEKNITLTANN
ncbi:MAG TPA: hypothetical protein LFW21_03545 [Rickettsia endosymbiont of Pyrocoelia pectoralis]|nr:hypothetical protein [Rickettsia endosymbiont of Pyrocoelia pectoralis]